MATESRVGMMLRQRRQELGIPLSAVSNSMNVRERVLETIESGDFDNYPPKGHAEGILSSYARYLDLDSRPVIQEFEREYQSYTESKQDITGSSRSRGRKRGGSGERSRSSRDRSSSGSHRSRSSDASSNRTRNDSRTANARNPESDGRYTTGSVKVVGTRGSTAVRGSRTGQARTERTGGASRTGSSSAATSSSLYRSTRKDYIPTGRGTAHYASIRERQEREIEEREAGHRVREHGSTSSRKRSRQTSSSSQMYESAEASKVSQKSTPNFFGVNVEDDGDNPVRKTRRRRTSSSRSSRSQSREPRPDENIFERISRILKSIFSERRTRIIALAFTMIVVGVIISASVLIGTAGNKNSGLIEVQGGAVNDTTTSDDGNAAHKTITTANGNPVTIKISVAEGETSLISITYDGGNPYSGTAVGPFTREFPVTESFSATFGNPGAVTVSENGNPLEIAKNNDGTGSLSINIQAASNTSSSTS